MTAQESHDSSAYCRRARKDLRIHVLKKMQASVVGISMDEGLLRRNSATRCGERPGRIDEDIIERVNKRSKSLSPFVFRRRSRNAVRIEKNHMSNDSIELSDGSACIGFSNRASMDAEKDATSPDITITGAANRVSGRSSGSGSGSETPDVDTPGLTVTFRRSNDGKANTETKNVTESADNMLVDRRSTHSRKGSPITIPDVGQASKTDGSPKSPKRERKGSSDKTNDGATLAAQVQAQAHATGAVEKSRLQTAATHLKNLLSPTYKTRNEEFKKLFKLPENDKFVIDYSCAYQREILVHGRMYMSQNSLCFYSIIIKWETTLTIRFKDIVSITKEKTAKIIPNAIQVCTKSGEKLFFASFSMRDKAFMMMFKLWQNALLDQPMNPAEMWVWANHGYDESEFSGSDQEAEDALITLSTTDDTEDAASLTAAVEIDCQNLRRLATSAPLPPLVGLVGGDSAPGSEMDSARSKTVDDASGGYLQPGASKVPRAGSGTSLPSAATITPATTPGEEFTESENEVEINCPCTSHAGKEMLNCVFPMSVDQLFLLLFTDSVFFRKLQEDRKTTDLVLSDWNADRIAGTKSRQISYVVALSHSIGPKSCSVTETQVCTPESKPGLLYVMKCDVCNMGVPYSETFSVGVQYCLSRVSANQCRLRVHAGVVYKKSCWGIVKNSHLHAECARFGLAEMQEEIETRRLSTRTRRRSSNVQPITEETKAAPIRSRSISTAALHPMMPSEVEKIAKAILLVLILMLLLNAALFYKLWYFESETDRGSFETTLRDFETVLKKSDLTSTEWVQLLHQIRFAQKKQLTRWLRELDFAIKRIVEVETALIELRKQIAMMRANFGADLPSGVQLMEKPTKEL